MYQSDLSFSKLAAQTLSFYEWESGVLVRFFCLVGDFFFEGGEGQRRKELE